MHRALGGAPVSPGHRSACVGAGLTGRSLGRSLRACDSACAAWPASDKAKLKNSVPAASVRATRSITP